MAKYLFLLLVLSTNLFIAGCGNSSYSSGQDTATTIPVGDDVTPFSPSDPSDPNYVSNHCSDITGQQHMFYGYMKNVLNRGSYQNLIASQTDCKTFNGWVKYQNGYHVFYEYHKYDGTQRCDWWSQQPMGVTVAFFKGNNRRAKIAIDATGNGWAARGGQGFPVRRMILEGDIDCSQEDLTIHAQTSYGWLTVSVEKEYGNKNAADMRAQIMFNGANLGKQQLRRVQ